MNIQKSFRNHEYGKLYLVGTPIGNLEDMTYRAVRILGEVDEIAAEDTRQTRKLLTHFQITNQISSYHEHNKYEAGKKLLDKLMAGQSIALVSDAGLPAISDPGAELVKEAIANNIPVIPIPGANAALSALIASGLDTNSFLFVGFLPRSNKERRKQLDRLRSITDTLLLYEAPHRIEKTLTDLRAAWGDRRVVLARELTKTYEEFMRGTMSSCLQKLSEMPARGEYCIVVEGANEEEIEREEEQGWSGLSIKEHVEMLIAQGEDSKLAMKRVAQARKIPRREVYDAYHELNGE